jgi:MFS transporter
MLRFPRARTRHFNARSLDALNFLLADVRGALGPYLNVFLVTQQGWSQSSVGIVTTAGGLIALAAQTPAGAIIDATPAKRGFVVAALIVLALGAVTIFAFPEFWPVMIANTVVSVVGDVFGPAVAALTLGLFARAELAIRMGRNGAFDHAGNVAIAVACGGVGWLFGQRAVFLLVPVFAALPPLPFFRSRPAPSTSGAPVAPSPTMGHAPGGKLRAGRRSPVVRRWWCSPSAACCSTSPTPRCCRWSGRSSPSPIRRGQAR